MDPVPWRLVTLETSLARFFAEGVTWQHSAPRSTWHCGCRQGVAITDVFR